MTVLPTLRQLQFLEALVKCKSFSKAAKDCFVSQSTLSAGIKELEIVLQTQLIDRSTRKFSLTSIGEQIAEKGRATLLMAEDLAQTARASKPLEGRFRLGVIPTIAPFLLPLAVPKINAAFPELMLYLHEGQSEVLIDDLVNGQLDAALLALPFEMSNLEIVELGQDPLWYAATPNDPLVAKKKISFKDLQNVEMLLLEDGHCLREHAIETCQLTGKGASTGFGATSLSTLAPMVATGMGATLLPQMAVDAGFAESFGLVARPIAMANAVRTIGLVFRGGSGRAEEVEMLSGYFKC